MSAQPTTPKSIWPKIPAPFVRAVLAGHSALGLAFAALIFLVCFSGTVAVFGQEWLRWETPQLAPVAGQVKPAAIDRALNEGFALSPKATSIYINLPNQALPRITVSVLAPGAAEYEQYFADADGHIVAKGEATPFTEFLTGLHIFLHLPRTIGEFIVGLTGVALLSSLISGLFAHPRVFRDAFHLRWGGSKRLHEADLHNRIGVWGLPFHVVVSLSGALLGLTTLLVGILSLVLFRGDMNKTYDLFLPPHPVKSEASAPLMSIQPVYAQLAQIAPGARPRFLNLQNPGRADQTIDVTAGRPDMISNGFSYTFDKDGKQLPDHRSKTSPGAAIYYAIGNLHFGWYGGLLLKVVYVLLGLGLTVVTASGVGVWLARRRDKGRPAPGWERIWSAFTWGQPAAYALTALASLIAPAAPMVWIWLAATAATLLTSFIGQRATISKTLRLAGAALLTAVTAVHVAVKGGAMQDGAGWVFDAVFLAIASALALSVIWKPMRVGSAVGSSQTT